MGLGTSHDHDGHQLRAKLSGGGSFSPPIATP